MALIIPKTEADELLKESGITICECTICGQRFSDSMRTSWPFCLAGIPHDKWSSKEQLDIREALLTIGDCPNLDFIRPALELKSGRRTVQWTDDVLPMYPNIDKIRLPKEKVREFRDTFMIQGYFIGNVLNKYNWTLMDLIDYSIKTWKNPELLTRKAE